MCSQCRKSEVVTRTLIPRFTRVSTSRPPMKPLAPVTKTRSVLSIGFDLLWLFVQRGDKSRMITGLIDGRNRCGRNKRAAEI